MELCWVFTHTHSVCITRTDCYSHFKARADANRANHFLHDRARDGHCHLIAYGRTSCNKNPSLFSTCNNCGVGYFFLVIDMLHLGGGMRVNFVTLHQNAVQSFSARSIPTEGFEGFLLNLIPSSPLSGFLHSNIWQILVFLVLFACGLQQAGEVGKPVLVVVDGLSKALFKLIAMVMELAPLAACGAMACSIGQFGFYSY